MSDRRGMMSDGHDGIAWLVETKLKLHKDSPATAADGMMRPGRYGVNWSGMDDRGRELARGVYFCRFTAGDYRATEKVVLQK